MTKLKYNDINTKHHHAKHLETLQSLDNYDYFYNSRRSRRERERRIFKFSCKVYKYIKKETWNSIPLRIRENICDEWEGDSANANNGVLYNPSMQYNKDFYKNEFNTWLLRQIKIRTDKSTYRDVLISGLL